MVDCFSLSAGSCLPERLKDFESVLSMVSFVITIFVALSIRSIRKSFRGRARLPQIINDATALGSKISATLGQSLDTSQLAAIKGDFGRAQILLDNALPLMTGVNKKQVQSRIRELKRRVGNLTDPAEAWDLYQLLQLSLENLKQSIQDSHWE